MTSSLSCDSSLVFVSGPPGSGKTTYASQLKDYILIDDPKVKPIFDPLQKYVITDPKLCYRKVFDSVNTLYPQTHWIFFRPNAVRCLLNVQRRFEKEPDKFISVRELARFCSEYELNFTHYLKAVNSYQIEEIHYELV